MDVVYDRAYAQALPNLKQKLKEVISEELDCSATEPDGEGDLTPAAINVRFRPYGPDDDKDFDFDIEVRAKWYKTRAEDVQQRTDRILHRLGSGVVFSTGVFVTLPIAGWAEGRSQTG